jgi:murein DD-endopeptidase MepM/ murein hydrolase activator NlpD
LNKALPAAGQFGGNTGGLAQFVEKSAYPERYGEHAGEAQQLLQQLGRVQGQAQQAPAFGSNIQAASSGIDLSAILKAVAASQRPQAQIPTPPAFSIDNHPLSRIASMPAVESQPRLAALLAAISQVGSSSPTTGAVGSQEALPGAAKGGGYVDPFGSGLVAVGRQDQGVDYNLQAGAPIRAVGNAQVMGVTPNWYAGQPFVYYKLLDGPQAGKYVYVAEQIAPTVKAGDRVAAGGVIGHYASQGTGIESGFATSSGQTLARATTGYTEGQQTPAGQSFSRFMEGLGVGKRAANPGQPNVVPR